MAAAILTLRRGTTTPSLSQSELFFNTSTNTLNVGGTGGVFTLVKIGSNTGNITLIGNLNINGSISGSTLNITGDAKIDGNVLIGGNIVLGTGSNDIITVNAPFTGSLIPQEDGQDDLGSPSKRFKELHVVSASIDSISLPGSGILSSSNENFGDFSQSVDFRLDIEEAKSSTLANYTSSVNNRLTNLELDSASQDNRLDNLELFTASQEDLNQTFATTGSNVFSGSQTITGSLDVGDTITSQVYLNPKTLNGFTVPDGYNAMLVGPVDINGDITLEGDSSLLILDKITLPDGLLSSSVTDFDTFSASIDGKVNNLGFATTESNTFIGDQTITGSLLVSGSTTFDGNLNVLGSVTASIFTGSFIGTLPSQDSRLDSLEQKSESVDVSILELNQYTSSLKTAISVDGSNLTVNGDLVVLGTTTQIDSTQLNIGDNIIELNYGGSVTKGGLYVKDATGNLTSGSMLWDSTIDRWVAGPSGSESIVLLQGGDNILSGSSQITSSLDFRYLEINGDDVVSGSSQIDITQTTGYTTFSSSFGNRLTSLELDSSSQDSRITQLESDSGSQGGRITSLEGFTSSQETINGFYNSFTSSTDNRVNNLEGFTSSIDTTIKNKIDLEGVVSSSSDTSTISLSIQSGVISGVVIGGVVSGSDQVTSSLDDLYEVSGSVSQLVGIRGISGSLGSAAWYNVSSSISDGNPQVLGNAGAVKDYIDEQLLIIGAGDITKVTAGNGISGGADSGEATITLDTASQHFIGGVNSTISAFSQSVDSRLDNLELFSSSLDGGFVTQQELGSATSSLIASIATKLNTGSYLTDSASFDSRLDSLEGETNENPLTFTDTTTINFTRNVDTITADIIGGVISGSSQVSYPNLSNIPSGIVSSSNQLLGGSGILSSSNQNFTNFSQSVDSRLDNLEANSASLDNLYEEKASGTHTLVSGSTQLTASYDNRYVTLEGDQSIGSTKTFNNIVVNGTGSFAFIQSTTGSSTSIGEAFIVLNENTPQSNFAGIKVVDSGSTFTTSSFLYDGTNNNWVFQHEGSPASGSSLAIFGPLSQGGLGTEVGLTENRIPKGVTTHGHHIGDSNISDSGTLITLNSNSQVNGNLVVTGTISANNLISGSSQVSYPNLSNIPAGIVSGSSQVNADSITNFDTNVKDKLNADAVVSGSTQITKTLQEVTTAGNTTSTTISITNSTASTNKTSGALVVTGGIGTSGDIFAGGDVVAYSSSDRRLKNNILPISNPLQKINQIGGYTFEWNVEKQDIYKGTDYGVIAQEIEEILPELVDTRENGYKAVKYDKLVSLLIEGIKDLSKQVDELKEKINKG